MGWTGQRAAYYYRNGSINRKAECDALFQEGLNEGYYKVVKSRMVGTVYYAAVRCLLREAGIDSDGKVKYEPLPDSEQQTSAFVVLTGTEMWSYINFYHKEIPESCGPAEARCPDSILDLLDETDSEWAVKWRQRCRSFNRNRKELSSLKDGARICVRMDGAGAIYEKVTGLFRYPVWLDRSRNVYLTEIQAAETGYEILRRKNYGMDGSSC